MPLCCATDTGHGTLVTPPQFCTALLYGRVVSRFTAIQFKQRPADNAQPEGADPSWRCRVQCVWCHTVTYVHRAAERHKEASTAKEASPPCWGTFDAPNGFCPPDPIFSATFAKISTIARVTTGHQVRSSDPTAKLIYSCAMNGYMRIVHVGAGPSRHSGGQLTPDPLVAQLLFADLFYYSSRDIYVLNIY